jgi:hypothetical protein
MLIRLDRVLAIATAATLTITPAMAAETKQRFAQAETGSKAEPPKSAPRQAPPDERRNLDIAFWTSVQSSNDCAAVKAYLTRFPDGLFVELAKLTEKRLCAPPAEQSAAPAQAPAEPPAAQPAAQTEQPVPPQRQPPQSAPEPGPQPRRASGPNPPPAPRPQSAPTPAGPDPETVRQVQAELIRVGCSVASPDGRWTAANQASVDRFNRFGHWRFDPSSPNAAMLAALRRHENRVCPLECEPGHEARGDTCVAIQQPPSGRRRAERTREPARRAAPSRREREAERRRERRAERPQRTQRAERPQRAGRPAGTDARGCRFVPRATGGGFRGDTIEVCN